MNENLELQGGPKEHSPEHELKSANFISGILCSISKAQGRGWHTSDPQHLLVELLNGYSRV